MSRAHQRERIRLGNRVTKLGDRLTRHGLVWHGLFDFGIMDGKMHFQRGVMDFIPIRLSEGFTTSNERA